MTLSQSPSARRANPRPRNRTAILPIPFRDLEEDAQSGVAGFLRFIDEPDGKGVRGALFIISARGDPLEFSFTRVDVGGGVLWRAGEARRKAVAALAKALFESISHAPDVLLTPAEETPPQLFSEDLQVNIPACRVAANALGPVAQTEHAQELSDSLFLIWVNGFPPTGGAPAKTIGLLEDRQLLLEPFARASRGLNEVFDT